MLFKGNYAFAYLRIFDCLESHCNLACQVLLNFTMENKTTQEMIIDLGGISKILSKIPNIPQDGDFNFIITGLRLMANILEIEKGPREFLTAGGVMMLTNILKHYFEKILMLFKSETDDSSNAFAESFDAIDACGMIIETIVEDGKFSYLRRQMRLRERLLRLGS